MLFSFVLNVVFDNQTLNSHQARATSVGVLPDLQKPASYYWVGKKPISGIRSPPVLRILE
jgi:hypothetical protein